MKKQRCIRCESLERPPQSKTIYSIKNPFGESIPLCAVCIVEIKEEEDFFNRGFSEEDEYGSEVNYQ